MSLMRICFDPLISRARRAEGLRAQRSGQFGDCPILYGFSPAVVPTPTDWPAFVHPTGYWFLDAPRDWRPPVALSAFLAAGPPPVYVGFGSMRNRQPQVVTALVVEALERAGQRGVLHSGWDGLAELRLPETIFPVDSIPHDWLFPRMAAIVHHGGAGTTAAALRAGRPAVVVPFFADQPFWARRVYELGVGPYPLPRARLTAARLADAITAAVYDPTMLERAVALGERLRAEDGVSEAVRVLMRYWKA